MIQSDRRADHRGGESSWKRCLDNKLRTRHASGRARARDLRFDRTQFSPAAPQFSVTTINIQTRSPPPSPPICHFSTKKRGGAVHFRLTSTAVAALSRDRYARYHNALSRNVQRGTYTGIRICNEVVMQVQRITNCAYRAYRLVRISRRATFSCLKKKKKVTETAITEESRCKSLVAR